MSTAVQITLIICITIIVLNLISFIDGRALKNESYVEFKTKDEDFDEIKKVIDLNK